MKKFKTKKLGEKERNLKKIIKQLTVSKYYFVVCVFVCVKTWVSKKERRKKKLRE